MANTAEKIKKATDEAQARAESAMDEVRSGVRDIGDEMSYQAESMKRNPLAMALLVVLSVGVLAAVAALIKKRGI